jgi:hypothetical protein
MTIRWGESEEELLLFPLVWEAFHILKDVRTTIHDKQIDQAFKCLRSFLGTAKSGRPSEKLKAFKALDLQHKGRTWKEIADTLNREFPPENQEAYRKLAAKYRQEWRDIMKFLENQADMNGTAKPTARRPVKKRQELP